MKFPTFLLLLFSLDFITCETTTTLLTSTPDQTAIESQLSLVAETESTTSSTSPKSFKTKSIKPSCRVVYKNIKPPSSMTKDTVTMACTVCNINGYKESCVYVDKKVVKNSKVKTPTTQESRRSGLITPSTEALIEKGTIRYNPTFETTAPSSTVNSKLNQESTIYIPRNAEPFNNEEEEVSESQKHSEESDSGEDETKEDDKSDKNEFYFGKPSNFIPKEYLDHEYDPKFYEEHDAAANVYHKIPYNFAPKEEEESSESTESTKESRKLSYRYDAPEGFEELTKVLPNVEPINVDKVKPRKRQKTIEYNEETSFSSDDEADNAKKSSQSKPSWRESDSEDSYEPAASRPKSHGSKGNNGDHGNYRSGYKPPFDMPAFDTKNCKVTYKESPSGGPKMKCMNCKDQSNAYSEECGVEYEEPTKHHEVYYNNGKYSPVKEHSSRSGYGSHQVPVHYYRNPYYNYRGNHKKSESKHSFTYEPFHGFYY